MGLTAYWVIAAARDVPSVVDAQPSLAQGEPFTSGREGWISFTFRKGFSVETLERSVLQLAVDPGLFVVAASVFYSEFAWSRERPGNDGKSRELTGSQTPLFRGPFGAVPAGDAIPRERP